MTAKAETVTILFTDLVGSTELLQRTGDERAQHIFKAHHRLLREAVDAHGGHEVKWLGDGLMVAFGSTHDAVNCAIAMQQSSRRPTAGERLEIRAGLNVGEVMVDGGDYFGTPVVVARRLCDRASGGQIFASDMIVRLLDGRGAAIEAKDLGPLELKGITNTVPAVEIIYQHDPMALLRKLPFVGREAEYETLTKRFSEARNARGSIMLLAGEPGIGKTRLTEEFCAHASSSATVIRGNCYEGGVASSFGPWLEALRSLVEQTSDADLPEILGAGAPDIAVMLPEIKRRLPNIEDAPRLDPGSERARLFESIGAFLRNADQSTDGGLVIFFDDLHWCDKPSLALLEQVARTIADRRIVIVGTYRDVEVDRDHPMAQTLAALRRLEHHEGIALHGFTEDAVVDLLAAIEPSEATAPARRALAGVLYAEADGNPLFIREVLNNLVETGRLVQQDGAWVGAVASIEDLGIPEGIKEVIGRRLLRLSDGCIRMLRRASAMTGGFTWDELCAICDEPKDQLLDALDEALGPQLIEARGEMAYAFTHALIRATLYDDLSGPRRVLLHRRIAEALEALYADDLDAHVGELAAHYLASGGDARKAIEYSVRAGDRAKKLFAWEEAAAHYRRALDAMQSAKAPAGEERCRVLLALAQSNVSTEGAKEGIGLLREAGAIGRTLGSAQLVALAANAFEEAAAKIDTDLTDERLALVDEALEMLGPDDSALKALTLAHRVAAASAVANARAGIASAGATAFSGHKDDALLANARAAVAMAERVGDDLVTAQALSTLHEYDYTPDNDRERLVIAERAITAVRGAEALSVAPRVYIQRGQDLMALGEVEEFRRNVDEYAALLERLRVGGGYVAAMQVGVHLADGKLAMAEALLDEYTSRPAGDISEVFASFGQRFLLRNLQGRLAEMEGMWRGIVQQIPGVPVFVSALAFNLACVGKAAEAAAELARLAPGDLAAIPRDYLWKTTLYVMSEAAAEIADGATARLLYDALLPYAAMNTSLTHILPYGSTSRVLGRLAALFERWDDAERHFTKALDHNASMGFSAWVAWTQLNFADMLLRRRGPGDDVRARELLAPALAFAREAGMAKVQADGERLLAAL